MKSLANKFLYKNCPTCIHKFKGLCVRTVEDDDYVAIKDLTPEHILKNCDYINSKYARNELAFKVLITRLEGHSEKERAQIH